MSTQKVFISGSIAVKKLDNEVLSSLQKMMQNGLQILVGDAKGVDSQIQDFFKRNNYNNIVVYSIEEFPRYIASKTFGFKKIEVGKKVLLQSGIEVDLNLDGRTFYTSLNQLFKFNQKVV